MSILSSLFHGEVHDKPNDVHNLPPEPAKQNPTQHTDGNAVLTGSAERRMHAQQTGGVRPALYYTEQEQKPCANGVWESPHTVASRLESKEEYPQG